MGTENVDVLLDLDGNGSLTTRYLRGDVVDQLFARVDGVDPYWYLTDRQGSIRHIVDDTGTVVKSLAYDGYGNITSETGAGELGRYAYTGREFDVEIEMQYNRARYYDPTTGRWTSQDPLGYDGGDSNLYRYVHNRPTNATDPSGQYVFTSYESRDTLLQILEAAGFYAEGHRVNVNGRELWYIDIPAGGSNLHSLGAFADNYARQRMQITKNESGRPIAIESSQTHFWRRFANAAVWKRTTEHVYFEPNSSRYDLVFAVDHEQFKNHIGRIRIPGAELAPQVHIIQDIGLPGYVPGITLAERNAHEEEYNRRNLELFGQLAVGFVPGANAVSFARNVADGNYGAAALDLLGLVPEAGWFLKKAGQAWRAGRAAEVAADFGQAGKVLKVSVGVFRNRLAGPLLESVQRVEEQLVRVVRAARETVAAGGGSGRAARLLARTPSSSAAYSRNFGSAVHEEAFRLIQAEQAARRLPRQLVTSTGMPVPRLGLTNSYGGLIPDIRMSLGGGREAVWDITTFLQAGAINGHAGTKYAKSFVDYCADVAY